ncbi:hypothetical protein ACFQFQ_28825 [Sulfitobacter porphyrae]|uniref:Uncharacterized protein n=1 Tax=Sulfitobacter porphyrae TaxID=1246864 RepID=A0ABW2BBS3_9RHOB
MSGPAEKLAKQKPSKSSGPSPVWRDRAARALPVHQCAVLSEYRA